jgi:uncharacterized protein with von Willebrand factor type A (vWA) domain
MVEPGRAAPSAATSPAPSSATSPATSPASLAAVSARFGALLHAAGLPVGPERSARFATAVELAGPLGTKELYWLARVTYVQHPADLRVFDAVFGQVFRGLVDVADRRGQSPPVASTTASPASPPGMPGDRTPPSADHRAADPAPAMPSGDAGGDAGDDADRDAVLAAASSDELLRVRDFAGCDEDELARVAELVSQFSLRAPRRRGRRPRIARSGRRTDLRRTLRVAHRTGGDPVRLVRRERTDRTRRVVLLADVSGSMAGYSRAYLSLLAAAVRGARAEAFVFATRLTRVTRPLAIGSVDEALRRAATAADDWSGGTRIGTALKDFNDRWGRRGLARGAVVVVVSDGWERGDPAELAEQMGRLARLAHRIVWVNPRLQSAGYEPLVGGMRAALPHVDVFLSGHSVDALAEVVAAIASDRDVVLRAG